MFAERSFNGDLVAWGPAFEALAAHSDLCVKIISRDGRIAAINEVGASLLGANLGDEICGTVWTDLWDDENRDCLVSAIGQAFAGTTTHLRLESNGTWDIDILPLSDIDGSEQMILAISRRVTESSARDEGVIDALHMLTNLVNATASAARLMRRGLDAETTEIVARELDDLATRGAEALGQIRQAGRPSRAG